MDECDMAREMSDFDLNLSLRRIRANLDAASPQSAAECEDCGEPIPRERQMIVPGCTRCVICQTRYEREGG